MKPTLKPRPTPTGGRAFHACQASAQIARAIPAEQEQIQAKPRRSVEQTRDRTAPLTEYAPNLSGGNFDDIAAVAGKEALDPDADT